MKHSRKYKVQGYGVLCDDYAEDISVWKRTYSECMFSGTETKYYDGSNDTFVTLEDIPPPPYHLFILPVAGVDTEIVYTCAKYFGIKTASPVRGDKKLLSVIYSCFGHIDYKTQNLFKERCIS